MEKAIAIQEQVKKILGIDEVFLVGGSVRDIVMGDVAKDYDFCTPMLPDKIEEMVRRDGKKPYTIGKKFGTIGFKVTYDVPEVPNGMWGDVGYFKKANSKYEYVEVTTFRSEVYTNKSRRPEVKFVPSLEEDLARRDFTMNAMILGKDGVIYDPYGGRLDIHSKQIKTVGSPKERIAEDPLRMLRAARFAARYNFAIDPNFIGKARQLADRIYDVSVERWVQELDKIIDSDHPLVGLLELDKMGVLVRILPEVSILLKDYPEFAGITMFREGEAVSVDTKWCDLLGWSGLPFMARPDSSRNKLTDYINRGICERLKFSNQRTDIIVHRNK